jgi:pimeloyl-ACP methyl ester carboxylesterase
MITRLLNQKLKRTNKRTILFDSYFNPNHHALPLVIFCHGYKGFKDWGPWTLVAKALAKENMFVVKFNFSYNGTSLTKPDEFSDLEAFSNNTYSKELEDLNDIIAYFKSGVHKNRLDLKNICLIGHSRGGGIVLLTASQRNDISKIITWASVSDYKKRFNENSETFNKWRTLGVKYIENKRTGQLLPHKFNFYKDFIKNENHLDIKKAIKSIKQPVLLIHGDKDDAVNMEESQLLNKLSSSSQLKIIEDANHVFNAKHPWDNSNLPGALNIVVKYTVEFIKQKASLKKVRLL